MCMCSFSVFSLPVHENGAVSFTFPGERDAPAGAVGASTR